MVFSNRKTNIRTQCAHLLAALLLVTRLTGAVSWTWDDKIKGIHEIAMDLPHTSDANSPYQRFMNQASATSTKHSIVNIAAGVIFPENSSEHYTYKNINYPYNSTAMREVKDRVREETRRGIKVTAVVLLYQTGNRGLYFNPENPTPSPRIWAFQGGDATDGSNPFRALIHLLATELANPDDACVSGYILGNEIQTPTEYYVGTNRTPELLTSVYGKALRTAWEEVSSVNPAIRIYASFNHDWSGPYGANALIRGLARPGVAKDVPWGIAYHPYPTGGSTFPWQEKFEFDNPSVVGMHNIDVLNSVANDPEVRYPNSSGSGRRIILSEQGVEDNGDPAVLPAVYSYFYIRSLKSPTIDALHWMSHQDRMYGDYAGGHNFTFGLLRSQQTSRYDPPSWDGNPALRKPVYDVYAAIDNGNSWEFLPNASNIKSRLGLNNFSDMYPSVVRPITGTSDIVNLSHRGLVRNTSPMLGGFIISGGSKSVLLRGVGATLRKYGLPQGYLSNPQIILQSSGIVIAQNDNWRTNSNAVSIQAHPAFALDDLDSALLVTLQPGVYNLIVRSVDGSDGIALFEIYDTGGPGRLINISTRCDVESGIRASFASVITSGAGTKNLLVRAVGPSLGSFGVTGYMPDPQLTLAHNGYRVAGNNDVANATYKYEIDAATLRDGAFPLSSPKDSAMWVRVESGAHSFIVEPAPSSSSPNAPPTPGGNCLIEIYSDD